MSGYQSPLLSWAGAVQAAGLDAGTAWHYGDPLGEQRRAVASCGLVDASHREVLVVGGPDRLGWLHAICSQHLSGLSDGDCTEALVLSMNGHVEQHWRLTELNEQIWIDTEAGAAGEALAYLEKMRFLKRVEPAVVTAEWALLSLTGPGTGTVLQAVGLTMPPAAKAAQLAAGGFVRARGRGVDLMVPRADMAEWAQRLISAGATAMGSWGATALRVAQRQARLGIDTDHRTLAHEAGWISTAVHLDKGCYRGQETVARVQNMGKPPRRLVLLHLSGDCDVLPEPGAPIERDGRSVGVLGTAVHHYELGPIALGLVKRTVGPGEQLRVAGDPVAIDAADAVGREVVSGFAGHVGPAHTSA